MKFRSDRHLLRLQMILFGRTGAHLVSLTSLMLVLLLAGYRQLFIVEVAGVLVLARVFYGMTRGPRPVLPGRFIRRRQSQVVADEFKMGMALAAACFLLQWPVSIYAILLFFALNVAGQCLHAVLSRRFVLKLSSRRSASEDNPRSRQVLIVGTGPRGRKAADVIIDTPEIETGVAGFVDFHRPGLWSYRDIPLIGHPDEVGHIVSNRQIDAVFVAVEPTDLALAEQLFYTAEEMGVPVCFMPEIFQPNIACARPERINGTTVVVYRAVPENQVVLAAKCILDKLGALCGLLAASPAMLLIALAIKLDSKGPVFYRQTRCGLNGKPFKLYKFRTMCRDADTKKTRLTGLNEMSGPVFKVRNDPRVTRFGRFLRRTSLDELPQFINVLKGDMSLVGPRPPLPKEVAQYKPWQHRKLSVMPGVTCTWQVSGRNNIDFEQWMKLDLEYIDNWSLWQDTKILARTIPAVLKGSGAS
ncbi:MAG: sugar transferase [Candidatus Zixiibacteriota bacterium]|nr:MAG: sugar transferase [candidate division Zixibacteria bacterium]